MFGRKKKDVVFVEKECADCEEIKSIPLSYDICYECWKKDMDQMEQHRIRSIFG
jgi:hypothetical protein